MLPLPPLGNKSSSWLSHPLLPHRSLDTESSQSPPKPPATMSVTPLLQSYEAEMTAAASPSNGANPTDVEKGPDAMGSSLDRRTHTGQAKKVPVLPTLDEAYHARNLAVAAHALIDELRGTGSDLLVPAKDVKRTAAAYADSRDDQKAATELADALYIFNKLVAETKPEISPKLNEVLDESTLVLPGRHHQCRSSNIEKKATHACPRDKKEALAAPLQGRALSAKSFADAAAVLADELRNTALADAAKAFAGEARKFAMKPGDRSTRAWFLLGAEHLANTAADTPYAGNVWDLLVAAEAVLDSEPIRRPLVRRTISNGSEKLSWINWLRGAISPLEARLPTQVTDDEAKLIAKRQILYAAALAAPLPLLTSAAGLKLFPGHWAWVAGTGVAVWILASCGMVHNQYGRMDWEKHAARHLGRLGVLGAALLFSFYAYRAFFPSAQWALWILIGISVVGLGIPWLMSCIRGDDVAAGRTGGEADTVDKNV